VPWLLVELLGLEPDGFARRLAVRRPCLPSFIDTLSFQGLRVCGGAVDLSFRRDDDGALRATVDRVDDGIDVEVLDDDDDESAG
jgi:hypothetical protein